MQQHLRGLLIDSINNLLMSIDDTNKKRRRGRPFANTKAVNVRIPIELLDRIDAYRGDKSRPEAIRELIQKGLSNG